MNMEDADKKLSVQFFLTTKEDPRATKEAGRPIHKEVEMVSIQAPGNQKNVHTAFAHAKHYDSNISAQRTYAERFAEHYDAFKRGLDHQEPGTPLAEVAFLNMAQKADMRAMKITTVEQLAGMADRDIRTKGMGFRQYVDAAKAYLDKASGTNAIAAEMAALRAEIERLKSKPEEPETSSAPSPFDQMEPEDLRNMLTDAGVDVDGRWGKARLVQEADKLAKTKEAA